MQSQSSAVLSVRVSLCTHVTGMRPVHIRPDGGRLFPRNGHCKYRENPGPIEDDSPRM